MDLMQGFKLISYHFTDKKSCRLEDKNIPRLHYYSKPLENQFKCKAERLEETQWVQTLVPWNVQKTGLKIWFSCLFVSIRRTLWSDYEFSICIYFVWDNQHTQEIKHLNKTLLTHWVNKSFQWPKYLSILEVWKTPLQRITTKRCYSVWLSFALGEKSNSSPALLLNWKCLKSALLSLNRKMPPWRRSTLIGIDALKYCFSTITTRYKLKITQLQLVNFTIANHGQPIWSSNNSSWPISTTLAFWPFTPISWTAPSS